MLAGCPVGPIQHNFPPVFLVSRSRGLAASEYTAPDNHDNGEGCGSSFGGSWLQTAVSSSAVMAVTRTVTGYILCLQFVGFIFSRCDTEEKIRFTSYRSCHACRSVCLTSKGWITEEYDSHLEPPGSCYACTSVCLTSKGPITEEYDSHLEPPVRPSNLTFTMPVARGRQQAGRSLQTSTTAYPIQSDLPQHLPQRFPILSKLPVRTQTSSRLLAQPM